MEYVVRLVIAGVLGLFLGLTGNRQENAQSGRVFSLICMGAALISIIAVGSFQSMGIPLVGDPGRLPAQIISALGFLGTGMIWITDDNRVMGMSAAASVWLTAILGMLIGAGMNNISVIGTMFFVLIYWISPFMSVRYRIRK